MSRRMFSPEIVCSDAFLDMPATSRDLYVQLGMRADDDGFVNPKSTMRILGSSEDDLKILLAKRFVLPFESGVVVIKHWLIHNLIRADLYKETMYKKEKATLGLNESGAYTELRQGVSELKQVESPKWLKARRKDERTANVPQTVLRIGKDRIGKDSEYSAATASHDEVMNFFSFFRGINPSYRKFYSNKTQIASAKRLLAMKPQSEWAGWLAKYFVQIRTDKFCPRATTPWQLEEKLGAIAAYVISSRVGAVMDKPKVV